MALAHADGLKELLAEVRRIELQSQRLVTDVMSGGYRSVFRGSGIEFDEVREYAEGDDPRCMDWAVSARMGRPFVRKYTEERELSIVFLLDLTPSMEGGFGAWSLRGAAARVAACLALAAVRNSDKVGLIAFGSAVERFVPPRKGARHALSLVRDCLALPSSGPGRGLTPALEFAGRALRRRAVIFLLSDFLEPGDWQGSLTSCARRHDLVAVRLMGQEWPSMPTGMMRLRDPESGRVRVVDGSHPQARLEYSRRVRVGQEAVEESLRRARVDRMDVQIPRVRSRNSVAGPILEFFRMREIRGSKR